MTPPADHRSTLRALVEAGEKAPDEDWFVKPRMGALPTVVYSGDYADEGEPNLIIEVVAEDEVGTASFVAQAANARPALAAIERKVWLDVETVGHLTGRCRCVLTVLADRERHDAALAAAAAELRAVEGQPS